MSQKSNRTTSEVPTDIIPFSSPECIVFSASLLSHSYTRTLQDLQTGRADFVIPDKIRALWPEKEGSFPGAPETRDPVQKGSACRTRSR